MPRQKEQNRVTPDTVENMRLEPQAAPVDKMVKQAFDEGRYRSTQGALEGLANLGKGAIYIEDTLQRKANENALNAVYKTKEENKNKWSEVSRNIEGMAKFNPYNDDAFRRILAGNITSKKIAEMKSIPEIEKMNPTEASAKFGEVAQAMSAEYAKAGLEPHDVYYSLDKFDKERKLYEQRQIQANTDYNYKRLNLARTYDLAVGMDRTIYDYDNFDKIAHAGQIEQGNIDINNRTVVTNPDGSISTDASIVIEEEGSYVVLPTVVEGKLVSPEEAIKHYDETGEHHGKFESQETAEFYAQELHERGDYYYHNRDKARALLGYLNKYTNQLISEGTPDDTIAKITLDAMKQAVTKNPEMLTSPEWERLLNDYKIGDKTIGQLIPDGVYEMQQFIRQAKRAAYQDRVLEHEEEQFDMQLKQEQAMVEYMDFMRDNPTGDRVAKAQELVAKYGLDGVYRLHTFEVMTKGYNSIAGLDNIVDDPDVISDLLHKAASDTLTIGDVDSAYAQRKISTSSLSGFLSKIEHQNKENQANQSTKASYHKKKAEEYFFGNSKLGTKGVLQDAKLKQQAYEELENLTYKFSQDGDYKAYNDAVAELKSLYTTQQQIKSRPKTFNNMKAIAAKCNANPKLSRQQYNQAMGQKTWMIDAAKGKNNIFRDRNDPTKNNKNTAVTDWTYNYEGAKQKSHNPNRTKHNSIDVTSDNGKCYVPYSCRNTKGMYVAAVYKNNNGGFGNTVIVYVPNKGFVAYHHLQSTGLPYEGMPVSGNTVIGIMGNTGSSRGVHVDVQYFDKQGNPKLVMNW